ncbi:MAG: DNA-directed RNA polymerase [Candidatus Diapherotrites archaeon]|nr:DNA-directed RNA polymerase [Candidatus Diapherotrites archaeon]
MFYKTKIVDKVRVPPKKLGTKIKDSLLEICREDYEGRIKDEYGVIIAITGIGEVGVGHVIPGDGSAYYEAEIEMLTYKPHAQEITRGTITESTEFGAFIRIGPIEGLIHVSQIMDDFINYDAKLPGFIGKKTDRRLVPEDNVLARIVTISLKGDTSSSKIGLTMRQPFLGKADWAKIEEKGKDVKGKKKDKAEAGEKPKKEAKGKEEKKE